MEIESKNNNLTINVHKKRNTQDLIFNFLLTKVREFPVHLTGYNDIESNQPRNQINNLLKKIRIRFIIQKNQWDVFEP